MGYDLSNTKIKGDDGYFRFNIWGWSDMLNTALAYGWKPEGTKMDKEYYMELGGMSPEDAAKEAADWNGVYTSNDFQRVTKEDAANMAAAIDKAVNDKTFIEEEKREWVEYLKKFIEFLGRGEFRIG